MTPLLTASDVATVLNSKTDKVYRLVREGRLVAMVDGRFIRIPQAALDEYIASHMTHGDQLARRRSA